jgi:localization factor PodJL
MAFESRSGAGATLDSWGLPASAASRRDTEEMMARVGRSEAESNEAWRRIEDQLRGLARRLDSSERSHGESNRVLSRTTQEMNITAREQAQAFDQLGLNVMALSERLDRLERSAANDGIREAVKALHQGLSRLADQITATANNSAGQVVQLTANLEQLASRVGQARVDAEDAVKALEQRLQTGDMATDARFRAIERTTQETGQAFDQRIGTVEKAVEQRMDAAEKAWEDRIGAAEKAMETRLAAVEKTTQFNTNALDHALEKIETSANQRATDQVENQRRSAQHEDQLNRLEDSIARLEMRLPDAEFERRLDTIESSVNGMADRMERHDPAERFHATMQAVSHRLEALEKDHSDLLTELRARVLKPVEPPAYEPAPAQETAWAEPFQTEPPRPEQSHHEPPQHYERYAPPPQSAFEVPPLAGSAPHDPAGFEESNHADPFAPSHGFTFDVPPEAGADPFAPPPDFEEVFADVPQQENFLAQARRSARAAAERAESERRGRFAGFFQKDADADESNTRSRYLIPLAVALLVAAAASAALLLNRRATAPEINVVPTTAAPRPAVPAKPATAPLPSSGANQPVTAPGNGTSAAKSDVAKTGDAGNFDTQRSEPAPPPRAIAPPVPAHPPTVAAPQHASSVQPHVQAKAPRPSAPAPDKTVQLANAGNPIALTILGLKALDSQPANLPEAVRFLTRAAEKGQAVAQYRLGTLYERGQGVTADPAKAAHWYEMSAAQGNRKAMHNLAVSYASGTGGKKNMNEAARWFAKAAALGLSDSQFNLAVLYERGDGVPQSLLDAYKWYSIAAAAGDSESKQRMGVLATQLSDADKAMANKSSATFRAAPLNRAANVPPESGDLG